MSIHLSSEQLQKIIEDKPDIDNLKIDKSNVYTFIKEYRIEEGTQRVPNFKIYYDYCKKWQPLGKKISKIGFFRKFKKAFKQIRIKNTRYYLIQEGIFDINPESIKEAKRFDMRYRNRITNRTVKNDRDQKKEKKSNTKI